MIKLKELTKEIESLRCKLIKIKENKCYSNPEVVAVSQELDVVLDKYQERVCCTPFMDRKRLPIYLQ